MIESAIGGCDLCRQGERLADSILSVSPATHIFRNTNEAQPAQQAQRNFRRVVRGDLHSDYPYRASQCA